MNKVFAKFNLLIFSLFVSLIFGELVIRTFFPMDVGAPWRISAPNGEPYLINTPHGSVIHKFNNYEARYEMNALGLRGPELIDEMNNIVFIGDSFTFGLFIDEKDTQVARIREFANKEFDSKDKIQIINAGIGASGIVDWIAYLEDYGRLLRPKLIIINLNYPSISRGYGHPLYQLDCTANRLTRTHYPESTTITTDYTRFGDPTTSRSKRFLYNNSQLVMVIRKAYQNIKPRLEALETWVRKISNTDEAVLLSAEIQQQKPSVVFPNLPYESKSINTKEVVCFTEAAFKKLDTVAKSLGSKLMVVDIGYRWQTKIPEEESIDLVALKTVPEILRKHNITYFDLTDKMFEAKSQGVIVEIPGDGHPTSEAYELLAKNFWPVLKTEIRNLHHEPAH